MNLILFRVPCYLANPDNESVRNVFSGFFFLGGYHEDRKRKKKIERKEGKKKKKREDKYRIWKGKQKDERKNQR